MKPGKEELRRFRGEAAALLGVGSPENNAKPISAPESTSPPK
jgi:hypothetical protein